MRLLNARRDVRLKESEGRGLLPRVPVNAPTSEDNSSGQYAEWIRDSERRSPITAFPKFDCPAVSFLVLSTTTLDELSRTLSSITHQKKDAWEIILAPTENSGAVLADIHRLVHTNSRVKLLTPSTDRAAALCLAAGEAKGEFICVLDSGDLLSESALDELAFALDRAPHAEIFYGDEDELSTEGYRTSPYFKPGWSPDLLYGFNYFGRLTFLRRLVVDAVGSFDPAAGAAIEWELNLKASDQAQSIVRIPKVLCHRTWSGHRDRPPAESTEAADHRRTIEAYWLARGLPGKTETDAHGTQHMAHALADTPRVSIIIPTKNKLELLRVCVDGLLHTTTYPNMEIVIVDTGSDDPETLAYYEQIEELNDARVVHYTKIFNYSAACNFGARHADGELLLFLNNDIEIIDSNWLREMVGFAVRPGVGVVGTKLIFPSTELQHGGVAIGIHLAALMYRSAGGQPWSLFGSPDHDRNWLAVMGACQLVRRDVFDQVDGFDESYLMAMSDVALCLRVWHAGFRTAYAPRACLVHHEGATRGHSNPSEDIRRLADDIRILGLDEDPYLHPELNGHQPIPALRVQGVPSVREELELRLLEAGSISPAGGNGKFLSDGGFLDLTGLPRSEVLWQPQGKHKIRDGLSAARWCMDLLRTDPEIRVRFPKAISEGRQGAFARWIVDGGAAWPGSTQEISGRVDQMFALDLGAAARQVILFRDDVRKAIPLGLTPLGADETLRWFLCNRGPEEKLRLENIWWLYLDACENPEREVVLTWSFTPYWQTLYPDAMTMFGRREFSKWFRATYRVEEPWAQPEAWPIDSTPTEQIRVAFKARKPWQSHVPDALHNVAQARELISWLQTDAGRQDIDVRAWLAALDLKQVAEELATPGLNVIGHFCYPSGLRVSAEALVEGLHQVGVKTALRDIRTDRSDDPRHVNYKGLEQFETTLIHTQPQPFFDQVFDRADLAPSLPRPYRIAYWYWEFDSVPESWAIQASNVDEVWAATEFVARGLRDLLPIPVRTLFPGVRLAEFKRRDKTWFGLRNTEFTFLFTFHMMSIMERKNPLGLIRAFRSAFEPDQDVRLVLKTSFGDRHPAQIDELRAAAAGHNITIIDAVYSPDEVLSLMDACDAYVSLHRSEGLGLTIAEAMLMGKPVIATNYSGNVDFMNEANSLPVPFELVKLGRPIPPYDAEAVWAEPSTIEAADLMRRVFSDQDWARDLGRRARENAEAHLSLKAAGQAIAARLAEISAIRRQPVTVDLSNAASSSDTELGCGHLNTVVAEVSHESMTSAPNV